MTIDIEQLREDRFCASRNIDAILTAARYMSGISLKDREKVLHDCEPYMADLRQLNDDRFRSSSFIKSALDDLWAGLCALAAPMRTEEPTDLVAHRSSEKRLGACPRCNWHLNSFPTTYVYPADVAKANVYCLKCLGVLVADHIDKLNSWDGFQVIGV